MDYDPVVIEYVLAVPLCPHRMALLVTVNARFKTMYGYAESQGWGRYLCGASALDDDLGCANDPLGDQTFFATFSKLFMIYIRSHRR